MDATSFIDALRARVPAATFEAAPSVDHPTFIVPREHIVETLRVLRDDPEFAFSLLVELTAADYLPREPRYEVVYHLVQLGAQDFPFPGPVRPPAWVRLKVAVPGHDASVPTASGVFANANWLEREVWDLFGIVFEGHGDLRRLLLSDDWEGHPLRKDYPVQVNVPYKSSQPMQLTEQEFVANIERQRQAVPDRGPRT